MRILAAFLGAACKIRFFEFGRDAAILSDGLPLQPRRNNAVSPVKRHIKQTENFGSSGSQAGSLILFPYLFILFP